MKKLVIIDAIKQTRKEVPESGQEIGRGKFLECDDKRVSRTHGHIVKELKGNKLLLRLEALHTNPIFCRKKDGVTDYTLKKEESILLEIGDKFKLIVDGVWFEVGEDTSETDPQSIEMTLEADPNSTSEDATTSKRKHDTEKAEEQSKKQRILCQNNTEPSTSTHPPSEDHSTVTEEMMAPDSSSIDTAKAIPTEIKKDPDALPSSCSTSQVQFKSDPDAEGSHEGSGNNGTGSSGNEWSIGSNLPQVLIKPDPDGLGVKMVLPITNSPSVLNSGVLRPSCDYGIRCYRAGQDHRTSYAHPGDLDYRRPIFPPPPPGSPLCPFGARCYRRNPQHFRDFDHPDPNADLLRRPLRLGVPRGQADDNMSEDEENPYESEPDFDDSSSDEYFPGHMDNESDDVGSAEDDNDSGLDC
uniref:PBZ-type domain-containing protein n=1 Tax=Anopheles christyi TaxID=43041 RepID=A0A182KIA1_9DIPT